MAGLLGTLARVSSRPRYAFMLLTLIAEAADGQGRAGPWVDTGGRRLLLRDWLGDALAQMAGRDSQRLELIERVRADLLRDGLMPAEPTAADQAVALEVASRARASARTNVSRSVSELVKAGLLRRHYQGYAVDHVNRGGQRHVVYTLVGPALVLLRKAAAPRAPRLAGQGELPF
ncbi:hypothetical protein [Novosphingobium sp.]|uniref:hypothetical protein n=1 Tax=Novosphingobium sp. TaxID=1874826 RepID=UPI002607E7E7|nr:hypothetical protein [Novosphingobium sp.]